MPNERPLHLDLRASTCEALARTRVFAMLSRDDRYLSASRSLAERYLSIERRQDVTGAQAEDLAEVLNLALNLADEILAVYVPRWRGLKD